MNTAEYLIKNLEELGISDFFGLPGDYNFNLIYAIQENPDTEWIGCTNELNAGYAADGYAREKGYGAIVTTYGVGELSAINAIAGSYAENVPVINIVGAPSTRILEEKQVVHHQFSNPEPYAFAEAYKTVTQTTAFLTRDNAKIEIDRVLKTFVKERKPVYICIPEDIAVLEISDKEANYNWISERKTLKTVAEKISEKIKKSERPIILADVLAKRFNAIRELVLFAEKSEIPVTNFVMGTGIFDFDYRNYLGTYLAEYGNPYAKKYLETTDCLIAVGPIYSDFNSLGFKLPYKIDSQVAIYGTYTYVDGVKYENVKMSDVLRELTELVETREYDFVKSEIGYEKSENIEPLNSEFIYSKIQEYLKEGDIIYAEAGLIPYGMFGVKLPERTEFNIQGLWCSIGWATSAAFGAGVAKPDSRVVLITGEGAHQISALEVGNMIKLGLKPTIIVINNKGYTIERIISGKPENELNNIVNINYSKLARIFEGDVWSTRVETAEDFDKALRVTGIMKKLCYIEVCVDETDSPALADAFYGRTVSDQKIKCRIKKTEKISKKSMNKYSTVTHESLSFN